MPEAPCAIDRSCIWRAADRLTASGHPTDPRDLCIAIDSEGEPCGGQAYIELGPGSLDQPGQPLCRKHAARIIEDVTGRFRKSAHLMAEVEAENDRIYDQERAKQNRKKARSLDKGWVYFARSGAVVKIGYSTNPDRRLRSLALQGGRSFDEVVTIKAPRKQEQRYHRQFSDHRQTGEWFVMAPEIRSEMDRLAAA